MVEDLGACKEGFRLGEELHSGQETGTARRPHAERITLPAGQHVSSADRRRWRACRERKLEGTVLQLAAMVEGEVDSELATGCARAATGTTSRVELSVSSAGRRRLE
eukprot:TRINITY_DN23622_c0_g1_i1.p3 TRINITY_DN23622_c0_g1~~TRINITY_DN23622_c0_g1_i1.p3  ORF type:complete len:107 (+),score=18.37 TRINITY_DN23622_c0_g1_i1:330-650(+)